MTADVGGKQLRMEIDSGMFGLAPKAVRWGVKSDGLTKSQKGKLAVASFLRARDLLREDASSRGFSLWSPMSGYNIPGASDAHERIYSRMFSGAKHPDYYSVPLDGGGTGLRRRLPIRHELAAILAGASLWPQDLM